MWELDYLHGTAGKGSARLAILTGLRQIIAEPLTLTLAGVRVVRVPGCRRQETSRWPAWQSIPGIIELPRKGGDFNTVCDDRSPPIRTGRGGVPHDSGGQY